MNKHSKRGLALITGASSGIGDLWQPSGAAATAVTEFATITYERHSHEHRLITESSG